MSTQQILRAWRDHDYWLSLSEDERARVPENPAGLIELMDVDLEHVAGQTHAFTHCMASCTCDVSCFGTCVTSEFGTAGGCCC